MLDDVPGPKVMIVGLPGSGKTTLAKTLVNWCMRMGRASKDPPKVLYANMDVSEVSSRPPRVGMDAPVSRIVASRVLSLFQGRSH